MSPWEYYRAKKALPAQAKLVSELSPGSPEYRGEMQKLFELLLTVKGHAWCMDVKSERRKAAKLLASALF